MTVKLTDGRKMKVDLTSFKMSEYAAMFDDERDPDEDRKLIARSYGMTYEEFMDLNARDNKLLASHFFEVMRSPLSESATEKN